jgi:hypothetical protein
MLNCVHGTNPDIVEEQLTRVLRLHADLLEILSAGESRGPFSVLVSDGEAPAVNLVLNPPSTSVIVILISRSFSSSFFSSCCSTIIRKLTPPHAFHIFIPCTCFHQEQRDPMRCLPKKNNE